MAAQSQIRHRLANYAASNKDTAGAVKHLVAFFEKDGLSTQGAQAVKLVADTCFTGLPEATKAAEDAEAAAQTARAAGARGGE